nr:unnamed protein product [Callosobruchus analis]
MESFGLHYTVYANTRGNACIDNIFTNLPNGKYCTTTVDLGISDHLGIVFCYSSSNNITLYNHRINIRPITEEGLYMLYNILQNVDWLFINDSSIELELKCEKFVFLISAAIDNSFPLKSKHANTFTKDKLQWFTPELNNIRDTLNLLREINKTYPELITKSSITKYHQYYKNQLNIAKRRYHDNYIIQSNNKQKARWEIINKSKQSRQCESCTLKPSELNNYFINIPGKLIKDLGKTSKDPLNYVRRNTSSIFTLKETTFNEVRSIIDGLKNTTSKDPYDMNVKIIKHIKNIIIIPFTKLINQCLKATLFPKVFKVAKVIPLHKNGSQYDTSNYRPIALLPILSKIFETIINKQIVEFFQVNNLFSSCQHGFLANKSTSSAIMNLTDYVIEGFEEGRLSHAVFYDLTKAFDCLSHDILLQKMIAYGFDEHCVAFMQTYLTGRCQYVSVNGFSSNRDYITYGVPQGSVLGPTLFLIYINDLQYCDTDSKFLLFADDTTKLNQFQTFDELSQHTNAQHSELEVWCLANSLKINHLKTHQLNFNMKHLKEDTTPVKYLGVHLDCTLTWEQHIKEVSKKLSKSVYLIRNLSFITSQPTLKAAYYGHFHSHLKYCIINWGHSCHIKTLFSLQRRCIRIISHLPYDACCRNAFINLSILTLPCIYILECLCYVRGNMHKFTKHSDEHIYNTRHKNDIHGNYLRLERSKNGINYHGIKFYNVLPNSLKALNDAQFKCSIKNYLLSKAFYSFDEYLSDNFKDISF